MTSPGDDVTPAGSPSPTDSPTTAVEFRPTRVELENGLTVLHQANPLSPAVTVRLAVVAGAVHEEPAAAGKGRFCAGLLDRGTGRRSKAEIGEVLDFTGATLSTSGGRHLSTLRAKCRATDFEEILELLAECAREPSFPADEVEKVRGDILTGLREDADNTRAVAVERFRELVYAAEHPYSRKVSGSEESVAGIERDELAEFHARHYRPGAAALVVVGAVDAERAVAAAREAFGAWEQSGEAPRGLAASLPEVADAPSPQEIQRVAATMPGKSQVDIALGHPGLRRTDDDYYAASVMNMVLGRFAMGGRLGRSVREEQGMAYYTYSTLAAGVGPGPFLVRAGVSAANVDRAVESIVAEIETLQQETVEQEELDNARSALIRSIPRTLETNSGMASVLHVIEQYDLGLDYLERYPELVSAVDAAEVQRIARERLHPDRYGLAVAGPYPAEPTPGESAA